MKPNKHLIGAFFSIILLQNGCHGNGAISLVVQPFGSGISTEFLNPEIHRFYLIYDATCSTTGCDYSLFKISPFSISAATVSRVSKDFKQSTPLEVLADMQIRSLSKFKNTPHALISGQKSTLILIKTLTFSSK